MEQGGLSKTDVVLSLISLGEDTGWDVIRVSQCPLSVPGGTSDATHQELSKNV